MPRGIYKRTEEYKKKVSLTSRGKPSNALGKHWKLSEEHKRKISLSRKGNKLSTTTKQKIAMARTGTKRSEESKNKIKGEKSHNWKGDRVGVSGMHRWVETWKGKLKKCEVCGIEEKNKIYDWANIDHTYKRILEDYIRMCRSCHRKYDIKNNNYMESIRQDCELQNV